MGEGERQSGRSRPRTRLNAAAALAGLAVLAGVGCAAPAPSADTGPAMHFPQRGRSLALAPRDALAAAAGPRWYDARNDTRSEVFAGYDAPRLSVVSTRDYDRVNVSNGRVRDHSHGYTLRESVRTTIRR